MKRTALYLLLLLSVALPSGAQAGLAQDLFDNASTLFKQNYYGWQETNRVTLVDRYRQQLAQQCEPAPDTCSYDTARKVLKAMFDEFRDEHTNVRDPEAAARLREIQNNLSVPRTGLKLVKRAQGLLVVGVQLGSPAAALGLQPGDLLLRVGGQTAGTDQPIDTAAFVHLERQNAPLEVVYQRRDQQLYATIQPAVMQARDLPQLSYLEPTQPQLTRDQSAPLSVSQQHKVALITLPSFLPADSAALFLDRVEQALHEGAGALIVDLRYNSGGRLDQCVAAASIFHRVVYQAKFQVGGWTFAGSQGEQALPLANLDHTPPIWTGPAAVLVGEDTASCAEVFAYYAHQNGVKIIGEHTKGVANSGINFFPLPDNGVLSLTTLRAYDEQGHALPGYITPDVVAPTDTLKLVQAGEDTTLQAALQVLEAAQPALPLATKPTP